VHARYRRSPALREVPVRPPASECRHQLHVPVRPSKMRKGDIARGSRRGGDGEARNARRGGACRRCGELPRSPVWPCVCRGMRSGVRNATARQVHSTCQLACLSNACVTRELLRASDVQYWGHVLVVQLAAFAKPGMGEAAGDCQQMPS